LAITSKGGLQLIDHNQLKQRGINHRQRRGITALQLAQHYEVDQISARSLRQLQQQQSARLHYFRTTTQQRLQWGPTTMGTKSPGDQNHHQVHHRRQHGSSQPESHGNRQPESHGNRQPESHGHHCRMQTITVITRAQLEARVDMLNCN
jgi:hypothetical protein